MKIPEAFHWNKVISSIKKRISENGSSNQFTIKNIILIGVYV